MSRILLVDDDDNFRKIVKIKLEQSGYEVLEAQNTPSALDITGKHFINLVITDLYMPEIDGIQSIILFKKQFPGLRIIAMTGACSEGRTDCLLNLAMEKGAIDSFKKIDSLDLLLNKIKSALASN
ncbi:MAG: hypothetical protein A2X47_04430 [Lentisphaerae bacterium GWF2_38_69]|nr:MAG: hypothetical protein A2X47_04430 [Lentisphaerae bacterium GWF2_38_69]